MLQIFIIILFRIYSKKYHYAHYYAQNLPIILIILKVYSNQKLQKIFVTGPAKIGHVG